MAEPLSSPGCVTVPDCPDLGQDGGVPVETWTAPPGGWPTGLWEVPYLGSAIPGAVEPASWLEGSNCQRFSYGLLSLFGVHCPPFRSSELWGDTEATKAVGSPQPLDLVLYNRDADSYGAHVGVWMAEDEILHLCAEVGRPVVWSAAEFAKRARYSTRVGYSEPSSASRLP